MRRSRPLALTLCLGLGAVVGRPLAARAEPLNPWGDVTPPGQLGVCPFIYEYNAPTTLYAYLYFSLGLPNGVDVIAGLPAQVNFPPGRPPVIGLDTFDFMLRWFPIPAVGLVARVTWTPGEDVLVGPELHFVEHWGRWDLTINAGYQPSYVLSQRQWTPGAAYLLVAPEFFIHKQVSIFLEADPTLLIVPGDLTRRFLERTALTLVPGISFAVDANRNHVFAAGVQAAFPLQGLSSLSFGLWYATDFTLWQPPPAPTSPG